MVALHQSAGGGRVAPRFHPLMAGAILALLAMAASTLAGCATEHRSRSESNPGLPAAAAFPQDIELSEEQQRQLELSREVLLSESTDITLEARTTAASLLIDLGAPESLAVLTQALTSTNAAALEAVLAALSDRPADPPLLDAMISSLATAPDELFDLAASLLVAHGESAQQRIIAIALDAEDDPAHRMQAIRAMGFFRNRQALSQLMSLLEPERDEPKAIQDACCAALQSLTGMRYGANPQRWRDWWGEFKDKPFAEVLRVTVQRLSDQIAVMELQNARLSELYAESLREIYVLLPLEQQLERLASDLGHELSQVRRLALDRVDRLLRDQARLPDSVKQQLIERLRDAEPVHRRMAARLLDEANQEGLRLILADRLKQETDAATANEFLRVLVKRPTVEAADAALSWLKNGSVGPNAAALLAQVAQAGNLPEEMAEQARSTMRPIVTPSNGAAQNAPPPPPAFARLLTVIGKERDLVLLEAMLDTGSPELKQAIADGLAAINRTAPLVARAKDPVIYPFALRATANGKGDIESLRKVSQLTPDESHREQWILEMRNIAGRLPIDQILTGDDVLAGLNVLDARARLQLLQRALETPAGEMQAALRRDIVVRAAELMLAVNEPTRALDTLETLGVQPSDDAVHNLKLRAAIRAGLYDRAEQIEADPRHWIALLEQLIEQDDAAAVALRNEIAQRFLEELDEPTRAAFEAAAGKMTPEPEPEASVDASTANDEPVTP